MKQLEQYLHTHKLENPTWDWIKIEKFFSASYSALAPKERIEGFLLVTHHAKEWLMVITDNRIILSRKSLFGKKMEEISINDIKEVKKFHIDNDNVMEIHLKNEQHTIIKVRYLKVKFEKVVNKLINDLKPVSKTTEKKLSKTTEKKINKTTEKKVSKTTEKKITKSKK